MVVAQARHQKKPVKRTTKSTAKGSDEPNLFTRHARDLFIVATIVVGLAVALGEMGALGPVGDWVDKALAMTIGLARFALPIMLIGVAVALIVDKIDLERSRMGWGVGLALVSLCGISHLVGGRPPLHAGIGQLQHAGGWFGAVVGGGLTKAIGVAGAMVVLVALLVVAVMLATGIGLKALAIGVANAGKALGSLFATWWTARPKDAPTPDEPVERRSRIEPAEPDEEPEPFAYEDDEAEAEYEYEEEAVAPVVPITAPAVTAQSL